MDIRKGHKINLLWEVDSARQNSGKEGRFLRMETPVLQQCPTIEQISEENLRLKAQLKRQEEMYENSNMELLKWMVESEKKSRQLTKLNAALKKIFLSTVEIVQNIIEIKDPGSKDHSERVSRCSRFLAQKMAVSPTQVELIAIAAKIHELGKVAIPESILQKSDDELDEQDSRILEHYPVLGAACLENIPNFQKIARIIKHQNEYYDGKGKPDGFSGDQIPIGSRIIAIADYFDTIYFMQQEYETAAEALTGLQQHLDTLFDGKIFPHLYAFVIQHYSETEERKDTKIAPHLLRPGMVLARDIISTNNVLLLPQHNELDKKKIEKLLKHQNLDPIQGGIFILNERSAS